MNFTVFVIVVGVRLANGMDFIGIPFEQDDYTPSYYSDQEACEKGKAKLVQELMLDGTRGVLFRRCLPLQLTLKFYTTPIP